MPLSDAKAVLRVGFTFQGAPATVEVRGATLIAAAKKPRRPCGRKSRTSIMSTNLRMALRALTQNKLQACLTLLGMSVGIAMVVIVSGLGRGAQLRIESQIEAAGPTRITIHAGNFTPSAIDSGGQQDSGGGEPGEGAFSATPGTGGDAALADVSGDGAAMDARRRMRAVPADALPLAAHTAGRAGRRRTAARPGR